MDYKETFLRCVEEGYDAGFMQSAISQLHCPYDQDTQTYEYNAWQSGYWWYMAEVH